MKFLALEKEKAGLSKEDFKPYLKQEARRAFDLHEKGVIREIYFTKEQNTAVIMLECESRKEAEAHLASLPLVQAGLISFTVIELVPYTGFSRLSETRE